MIWALALATLMLLPSAAEANFVYWTNDAGTTIGRAKLNGTAANSSFVAGLSDPHGIATDANFIYWSQGNAATGSIGRAKLDGSGANPNFVPHSAGVDAPRGVAVTAAAGVFWAQGSRYIGHANLDGSNPQNHYIDLGLAHNLCGVAADSAFVYWGDTTSGDVGRASQGGGSPTLNFLPLANVSCGVAVDGSFLYWGSPGTVGRAPVGGGPLSGSFIPSAGGNVNGVAVNPQYLFWANSTAPTFIGRSNLSGSGANSTFTVGPSNPVLLAAAPSNKLTFTGTSRNKKKGTAKVGAKVSGPGQVQLSGTKATTSGASKVKPVGLTLAASGPFSLPVKVKGKTAKTLKKKGKVKVTYYLTFTPAGVAGVPNSVKRSLTLLKKLKKKGEKG